MVLREPSTHPVPAVAAHPVIQLSKDRLEGSTFQGKGGPTIRRGVIPIDSYSVLYWEEYGACLKPALYHKTLKESCIKCNSRGGAPQLSALQYITVQNSTVSNQSLQRVSATPQSTLDKSSCQYNLFGYHT